MSGQKGRTPACEGTQVPHNQSCGVEAEKKIRMKKKVKLGRGKVHQNAGEELVRGSRLTRVQKKKLTCAPRSLLSGGGPESRSRKFSRKEIQASPERK